MPEDRKVFSEQEVSAVVRRAIELQEQAGQESYTPGVTSEELARVAKELGIEAKYLQQAVNEAGSTESRKGPLNLTEEFERVVDVEISPDDYDVLLKHLRPTGNRGNSFNQVGRTLTGQTWTGCSFAGFEITSKKGRTRIKMKSNPLFAWLVSIHPATIATIGILGGFGGHGKIWLGLLIASTLLFVAWLAFQTLLKAGHKKARLVTDRLAEAIADAGTSTQPDVRQTLAGESAQPVLAEPTTLTDSAH